MTTSVLSASSVRGTTVRNPAGADLGSVKDLMIDMRDGGVRYAVLSFGGVLGIGDKLFAVPFESLAVDTESETLVLDVDESQLANAPGFDDNDWPDFANPAFRESIDGYYGPGVTS